VVDKQVVVCGFFYLTYCGKPGTARADDDHIDLFIHKASWEFVDRFLATGKKSG
jgi:hypothetical protein